MNFPIPLGAKKTSSNMGKKMATIKKQKVGCSSCYSMPVMKVATRGMKMGKSN